MSSDIEKNKILLMSQCTGVTESGCGFSLKPSAAPPPINWQGVARDLGLGSGLVKKAIHIYRQPILDCHFFNCILV